MTDYKNEVIFTMADLECPICMEITDDLVHGKCGHVVCNNCKKKIDTCPTCRDPMKKAHPISKLIKSRIRQVEIPCHNNDGEKDHKNDTSCNFFGTIGDYIDTHKSECKFDNTTCRNCQKIVANNDLVNHNTVCAKFVISCDKCGDCMFRFKKRMHDVQCKNAGNVTCPKCDAKFPPSKLVDHMNDSHNEDFRLQFNV